MKLFFGILILSILLSAYPVATLAQGDSQKLVYGDDVNGEISTQNFEITYTFDGLAGDIVMITMNAENTDQLDPYLYLLSGAGDILLQNDDSFGLNSRLIVNLPADDSYQIIATRRSGRSGNDKGKFSLSLDKVESIELDHLIEGQAIAGENPMLYIFISPITSRYVLYYKHLDGLYFPNIAVSKFSTEYAYTDSIASISGQKVYEGHITIELEADTVYFIAITNFSYYPSEEEVGNIADYHFSVALVEETADD